MNRIFNMDNKFFVFMGRIADLIILNFLCLICCIPIITAGASITAMFYVTLKMVRNEESYIFKGFLKSFKENLKQSIVIHLIMLVLGFLLYLDFTLVKNMPGTMGKVLLYVFMVFIFVYFMIFIYIYPVLSKFYNTVRNTFRNSLLMAIRHLPYTILMMAVSLLPLAVLFIPTIQVQSLVMMLLFLMGSSSIAYINSMLLVKIFDKYIPEETEDSDSADVPSVQDTNS